MRNPWVINFNLPDITINLPRLIVTGQKAIHSFIFVHCCRKYHLRLSLPSRQSAMVHAAGNGRFGGHSNFQPADKTARLSLRRNHHSRQSYHQYRFVPYCSSRSLGEVRPERMSPGVPPNCTGRTQHSRTFYYDITFVTRKHRQISLMFTHQQRVLVCSFALFISRTISIFIYELIYNIKSATSLKLLLQYFSGQY